MCIRDSLEHLPLGSPLGRAPLDRRARRLLPLDNALLPLGGPAILQGGEPLMDRTLLQGVELPERGDACLVKPPEPLDLLRGCPARLLFLALALVLVVAA
eukprot:3744530-Pyramimonas_sp.AAC.1